MYKKSIYIKIHLFIIFLAYIISSCALKERTKVDYRTKDKNCVQKSFECFDTECNIKIYSLKNEEKLNNYIDSIIDIFNYYDDMFSKTKVDSEIYKINHRDIDEIMTYKEVANLFLLAKELYVWSGEKFDISAGALYDLWDVKNRKELPLKSDIIEVIQNSGDYNYEVIVDYDLNSDKSSKIIFGNRVKVTYDFGALVKGYACDEVKKRIISDEFVDSALINLGGNVCCIGENPDREDKLYRVGIYKPFSNYDIADVVSVKDKCVITSGNYQRYFKIDGDNRIYHHIIDPKTGYPTDNGLSSVTIISENGLLGDYLSTTSMLIGETNALNLISQCKENFDDENIEAIFIYSDGRISK